jgi:hypothetical protein
MMINMKVSLSKPIRKLRCLFLVTFLTSGAFVSAQQSVSIGTTTVKNNAVLYLFSAGKNQGLIVPVVSAKTNVSTPDAGMLVYDESDNKLYYRNNSAWIEVAAASGVIILGGDLSGTPAAANIAKLQGKTLSAASPTNGQILKYNSATSTWELSADAGAVYTAGTGINITSNQIGISAGGVTTNEIAANTITNADLNKTNIPLSGFGAAAANVDMGSQKLINVATPTLGTDATTKAYVDAADATKLSTTTLTTAGDILYHDGTAAARLARGTNGQVLQSSGTNIQWVTPSAGLTNPMTTLGDIIVGGASGTPTRLGGTAGFLKSTGAATPTWGSVNLNSTDVTSTLPLANGGTGATTAAAARTNLGLGTLATLSAVDLSTTQVTSTLPLANGGTGATTATAARTNLGLGNLAILNAVGSTEITDDQIVDADVSATANIDGTKIIAKFGTQNVVSTGNFGVGTTSPINNLTVVAASGDGSIGISSPGNNYALGVDNAGSFKISNSTALGTNDHVEITAATTEDPSNGTGIAKVIMNLGGRGQDGLHILSTSPWGTSIHLSNGSSTSTSSGYTMAVTGTGGPTGQAGDFAMINGISRVFTIGSQSGYYATNFPTVNGLFSNTPMRMGVNLAPGTNPAYNLQVSGTAGLSTGTTWTNTSDRRLKQDISQYRDGLNVITKINPVWFRYNGKGGTTVADLQVGVIAQEMKEIAPYTVGTFKARYDDTSPGEQEFYNFNYSAIGYAMINAVKELDNRVKTLEQENAALKQKLQDSVSKENDTSQQLKTELQTQKTRTDQLEAQLVEIKRLLNMEAKGTEKK